MLELHFKYLEKVEKIDENLEDEEENEDANYVRRLEGGLFTLQLIDYIILEVCAAGPTTIKQRVMQVMNILQIITDIFNNNLI